MALKSLLLIFTLSFQGIAFASTCSKSLDGLEQLIHVSKDSKLFPQRLDHRLLGRFKASKGFYVFEVRGQMTLGIDFGILGKKTYPIQTCLGKSGWLKINALYEGKIQSVFAKPILAGKQPALQLRDGTGPLEQFKGVYPRQNMNLSDIQRFFN